MHTRQKGAAVITDDGGHEFEQHAIALARAKHDPSLVHGAIEFEGAEHDGAFVDETSINVYEVTTLRTKEKAQKDGEKLARLIKHLLSDPKNRYKSATGYFVTQQEPEIEQRKAIEAIAKNHGVTLHCLSFLSLQTTLVDVDRYIALRLNAPFGSTQIRLETDRQIRSEHKYIQPTLRRAPDGGSFELAEVQRQIAECGRIIVTGDFGIGKSAALREVFRGLRKAYFQKPHEKRFPIHINLRDCIGLRSPREILQRHAEEVGFTGSNGLIAAWRAGRADLLLDGFDELIPARWVGSARDLKSIRWQTLAPVRELIAQTPGRAAVVIVGRPQYFATNDELYNTLGMAGCVHFELCDFSEDQVQQYVGELNAPQWLPSRPLFVEFLAQDPTLLRSDSLQVGERGRGWRRLLRLVSEREARRVSSIPAETFETLIARIAVVARAESDGRGPVSIESMRRVFYEACGYEAEEEGIQALLRLPGLASNGMSGSAEMRTFVDTAFADAAFALDLARYISAPFADHVMRSRARWSTVSSSLVAEVAADELISLGFDDSIVSACLEIRSGDHLYDATLFDAAMVLAQMSPTRRVKPAPFFADVLVERLELADDDLTLDGATLSGCVLETLDVTEASGAAGFPTFQNCDIGTIEGWKAIPADLTAHFPNCTIGGFSGAAMTTAGLLRHELPDTHRVALTILKKVYAQAGGGRQLPALARGLPLELRPLVEGVVQKLADGGFLEMGEGRGVVIARPVRSARREALSILETPSRVGSVFDV